MSEQGTSKNGLLDEKGLRALDHLFSEARISLVSCIRWQYPAPWQIPWRMCLDSFFFFPLCSRIQVTLKGKSLGIEPGSFLMLAENVYHGLSLEAEGNDVDLFALHCHIHDRWGRAVLFRLSSPVGNLGSLPETLRALQETAELMQTHLRAGQLRGENFVRELLASQLAKGMHLELPPRVSDPRVGVVLQTMEKNFSSPELSVAELAREVKISVVQLRKLFRRETGVNPKSFLNTLRLREAARQLRQTSASIKEVAAACGFSQDHYFHRVFRQAFACTPSAYRDNGSREV